MASLEDEDDVMAMRGAQKEVEDDLREFDESVKIVEEDGSTVGGNDKKNLKGTATTTTKTSKGTDEATAATKTTEVDVPNDDDNDNDDDDSDIDDWETAATTTRTRTTTKGRTTTTTTTTDEGSRLRVTDDDVDDDGASAKSRWRRLRQRQRRRQRPDGGQVRRNAARPAGQDVAHVGAGRLAVSRAGSVLGFKLAPWILCLLQPKSPTCVIGIEKSVNESEPIVANHTDTIASNFTKLTGLFDPEEGYPINSSLATCFLIGGAFAACISIFVMTINFFDKKIDAVH